MRRDLGAAVPDREPAPLVEIVVLIVVGCGLLASACASVGLFLAMIGGS